MADVALLTSPVDVADIDATGTPDSTTFLRGDGAWAVPGGGGGIGTDYASASTNAGQTFTSGAAVAIIDFEDVILDPGSDITTGASWHYTAPTTGIYRVGVFTILQNSAAFAENERVLLQLFKNGSLYRTLDRASGLSGSSQMVAKGSTLVPLTAGDTIDVRYAQNSGSNLSFDTGSDVYIDINRLAT